MSLLHFLFKGLPTWVYSSMSYPCSEYYFEVLRDLSFALQNFLLQTAVKGGGGGKSLDLVMEIKTAKCTVAEILLAGTVCFDSWLPLSFHLFISSAALPLSLTEVCSEAGNYWYILLCARLFWDWLLTCFYCTDLLLFPWLRSAAFWFSLFLWHRHFPPSGKTLTRFL